MELCYGAVLSGGPVSVTWTGQSTFAARMTEICVDITAEADLDIWCCQTQGHTVSLIHCTATAMYQHLKHSDRYISTYRCVV